MFFSLTNDWTMAERLKFFENVFCKVYLLEWMGCDALVGLVHVFCDLFMMR